MKPPAQQGEVTSHPAAPERVAELIVEAVAEALLLVGPDGRIERVNKRVTEMFGYPAAALLGQPVEMLIPERFRDRHVALRERFATAMATRMMGSNLGLFGRRRDGTEFPVEVGLGSATVGARRCTVVSVADVSRLRQSEQEVLRLSGELAARLAETTAELNASERNFQELAEHIDAVFWLVSPDWRTLHYVSPAYRRIWGAEPASLYENPLSWLDAVHAEDRDRLLACLAEAAPNRRKRSIFRNTGWFARTARYAGSRHAAIRYGTPPASSAGLPAPPRTSPKASAWTNACTPARKGAPRRNATRWRMNAAA